MPRSYCPKLRYLAQLVGLGTPSTALGRASQENWNQLGGHINPFNPALYQWLNRQGLSLHETGVPQRLAGELGRQATMVAFVQVFLMISASFLLLAPLLLLMRKARPHGEAGSGGRPAGQGVGQSPDHRNFGVRADAHP